MFNIKWGVIAGGAAFIISLLVGGFSDAVFIFVLLRAFIFLLVFFAIGVGCHFAVSNYLPELLTPDSRGDDEPAWSRGAESLLGSRINITLGGNAALPETGQGSEAVGNIADLMSMAASQPAAGPEQGMDQTPQDGYTEEGGAGLPEFDPDNFGFESSASPGGGRSESRGAGAFEPAPAYNGPVFTASAAGEADLGGLPDLDAMAGAFFTNVGQENPAAEPAVEMPLPARSPQSSKPQGFEGDFNPKELAAGIRTVLSKEKQG